MLAVPTAIQQHIATLLGSDSVTLQNPTLRLYQNNQALSSATQWSDLVEANFDGYSGSGSVTFTGPAIDASGASVMIGVSKTWLMTGSSTPNIIYGWALTQGSATITLVEAVSYDTPRNMTGPTSAITALPYFTIPWGEQLTFDN